DEPPADRPVPAASLPVVLATLFIDRSARKLRLSSPRGDTLQQVEERLLARMPGGSGSYPGHPAGRGGIRALREATPLPLPFLDADVWTVRLPPGLDPIRADDLRREWVEHYYEDSWIHGPRQALDGLSPLAAAEKARGGDVVIRAKLAAAVDFREQLARRPSAERLYHGYPFDRVRRRLGLAPADPAAVAVDPGDLSCAAPWEIAALDPPSLDDHRLVDAVASAAGLLDDTVTAPLAIELLRRSIRVAGVHLVGAVSPLVRRAMRGDDPDAALEWIERARSLADATAASMLDVWRAEILARIGRPEESLAVYRGLIRSDASGAVAALDAAETLIDNRHYDQARPLLDAARHLARSAGLPWTERRARELIDGLQ
ncbi:MAG: tetratricopeptide repeat protein, partial [Isosphaeraceae bacterium]